MKTKRESRASGLEGAHTLRWRWEGCEGATGLEWDGQGWLIARQAAPSLSTDSLAASLDHHQADSLDSARGTARWSVRVVENSARGYGMVYRGGRRCFRGSTPSSTSLISLLAALSCHRAVHPAYCNGGAAAVRTDSIERGADGAVAWAHFLLARS